MTSLEAKVHSFDDVERVIAKEDTFKARIGAGANTFTSLRLTDWWATLSGFGTSAGAGAGAASWAFAPSWIAAGLGATTPVGLVVGVAAAAGGMYIGVARIHRMYYGSRVDEIPRFLNTPIDVLGASFFDLVGSLAVKVAAIDGHIHEDERRVISEYFVEEWGYDPDYTSRALNLLEETTDEQRVSEMAATLAEFARTNPDCDFSKIQKGLNALLTEIAEADGKLDEREEMAIERIVAALDQENSTYSSIKRAAVMPMAGITSAANWVRGKFSGSSDH